MLLPLWRGVRRRFARSQALGLGVDVLWKGETRGAGLRIPAISGVLEARAETVCFGRGQVRAKCNGNTGASKGNSEKLI